MQTVSANAGCFRKAKRLLARAKNNRRASLLTQVLARKNKVTLVTRCPPPPYLPYLPRAGLVITGAEITVTPG